MPHKLSREDLEFVHRFESCGMRPGDFDHRAHVRLAYCYLAQHDTETARRMMSQALRAFLAANAVDPGKYHETLTTAWIRAVRHFMGRQVANDSASGFIDENPVLLNPAIMLTHYSAEVLFSDEARRRYVEPDLDPIPQENA